MNVCICGAGVGPQEQWIGSGRRTRLASSVQQTNNAAGCIASFLSEKEFIHENEKIYIPTFVFFSTRRRWRH